MATKTQSTRGPAAKNFRTMQNLEKFSKFYDAEVTAEKIDAWVETLSALMVSKTAILITGEAARNKGVTLLDEEGQALEPIPLDVLNSTLGLGAEQPDLNGPTAEVARHLAAALDKTVEIVEPNQ
ncbi:MAG: hypothetical protein QG629_911 [Patescibacteria group bacterium]|nr:hypothetical protein [Candidatus Saccharibacteria bacterium]MDQ5963828.1 hypothetical protein [Patescibacteria group bacterium]